MQCSKQHLYSITSSARNNSEVGTDMPKAFAVRKFTTNSNTGRQFDRQFGRFNARQNLADHDAALPECIKQIWPVGQQSSGTTPSSATC